MSFKTTETPLNFVSYVYKNLDNAYKHFGTRMRIVGKIENNIASTQTALGSIPYYQVSGSQPDQNVNIGGGSGGLAVLLNPETNNGYYFEIIALTEDNITPYLKLNKENGFMLFCKLLVSKIVAADKVSSSKLRIPLNSKILKFSRLRFGNEIPMAYQTTSIPIAYIGQIEDSELEGSLEDLLQNKFGISITTSQTEIAGDFVDQKISKLLEITTLTPCLVKETIDMDQRSRSIMWNKTWYNAERFKIKFEAACNVRETKNSSAS